MSAQVQAIIQILDVAIAAANTITRANDLLQRAQAGEEIGENEIAALVRVSEEKRRAFDEAAGNG